MRRTKGERLRIRLAKGLDLPIPGAPRPVIDQTREPGSVALLGHDQPRTRCDLRVSPGDRVRRGQVLFVDHRRPEIRYTSPAEGVVSEVRRFESRQPIGVTVDLEEKTEDAQATSFPERGLGETIDLERSEVKRVLIESGEWPSLRARPGGDVPDPDTAPDALFIRVMDTNPLAADAAVVLAGRSEDFRFGVAALARLLDGPVFVCCAPGAELSVDDLDRVRVVEFEGPHPAGLVGTHIDRLFPLRRARKVWYTGYQEALAIGHLFRTGRVEYERVIALGGPLVRDPRLLRTRRGASTEDLIRDELLPGECRVVSGSLLAGRRAATAASFLGRYHEQISVIANGGVADDRAEAGRSWLVPGLGGARRLPPWRRPGSFSTKLHGRPHAMLPLHVFDDVVPLRIPIALLLRSLAAGDFESARRFGALDLEEEDLALCSYLCPGKLEYGELLRTTLDSLGTGRR